MAHNTKYLLKKESLLLMNSVYSRNVKKALKQLSRGVLSKSCSENMLKFTGEHSCRSVISIKLLCNFIEIALWHGCSPVNLLNIFRTTFSKNTSGWLLLKTHTNQSIQQAFDTASTKTIYKPSKAAAEIIVDFLA